MQTAEMKGESGVKDNLLSFRTSQQAELRANLVRLTRHLVVFEIYSPATALQTSEVLTDFKIVCSDRLLYAGRALVRKVVHTGFVAVVEADLDDSWVDIDFCISAATAGKLGALFGDFVQEWQKLYRVRPEYKLAVADLHTFLADARIWLEQVELGIRSSPSGDRLQLEQEVLHQLDQSVVPVINSLFSRFEEVTQSVEEDLQPVHRVFGKRQLHPLLLASPFVYRTFHKPLGFAGDYEVVNMMFRSPYEGASVFGKVINAYALQLPPIIAHRNRIDFLGKRLVEEALRAARENRVARIFNLGCGPAQEVQRFLLQDGLSERAAFVLADFNDEALAHVQGVLVDLKQRHGGRTAVQVRKQSVQHLLKQADRGGFRPEDQFDMVYCAGLFDYLGDRICRKLMDAFYEMLAPGGLLVATNVDEHPSRGEMEHFLEWHLVHRNTMQMRALAPQRAHPDEISLERDRTGVNIFMSIRKMER